MTDEVNCNDWQLIIYDIISNPTFNSLHDFFLFILCSIIQLLLISILISLFPLILMIISCLWSVSYNVAWIDLRWQWVHIYWQWGWWLAVLELTLCVLCEDDQSIMPLWRCYYWYVSCLWLSVCVLVFLCPFRIHSHYGPIYPWLFCFQCLHIL